MKIWTVIFAVNSLPVYQHAAMFAFFSRVQFLVGQHSKTRIHCFLLCSVQTASSTMYVISRKSGSTLYLSSPSFYLIAGGRR
uniref:Uncharacterized protein n=1 Tax=Oryza brachyantha TaxID=4533 RepID=J3LDZ5_ORYBR